MTNPSSDVCKKRYNKVERECRSSAATLQHIDGLAHKYGAFRIAITRGNLSSFFDLQSMLMVEENQQWSKSGHLMGAHYTRDDFSFGHGRGNDGRNV